LGAALEASNLLDTLGLGLLHPVFEAEDDEDVEQDASLGTILVETSDLDHRNTELVLLPPATSCAERATLQEYVESRLGMTLHDLLQVWRHVRAGPCVWL
jgi:hypothetical protein